MAKALKMASVGPVMVTIRSGQFPSEMLILAPLWKEKSSSGIATAKQPFEALSLGQVLSQASPSSSSVPASQHLTLKFSTPSPAMLPALPYPQKGFLSICFGSFTATQTRTIKARLSRGVISWDKRVVLTGLVTAGELKA